MSEEKAKLIKDLNSAGIDINFNNTRIIFRI